MSKSVIEKYPLPDPDVSPYAVRDWAREDRFEFPSRNHIRDWVREEFLNRARNFGSRYTESGETSNFSDTFEKSYAIPALSGTPEQQSNWDQALYKGSKSAWVRMCSNAVVQYSEDNIREGLILTGNTNFDDTYGFLNSNMKRDDGNASLMASSEAETLIGYDINGLPHKILEPDYKHRPSPGITSVESEDIEPGKNFRRTTISFNCWSPAQLDYLDNYFFQVGSTVVVEWGWNTFPRNALLPLDKKGVNHLVEIFNNKWSDGRTEKFSLPPASFHLRKGKGNYGFVIGIVHKFDMSVREDGGFDCKIEVCTMSEIGHQQNQKDNEKGRAGKNSDKRMTLRDFVNNRLGISLIKDTSQMNKENSADTIYDNAIELSRGRFFTFDVKPSSKPYYAGKDNKGGTYITVGYFIDILNLFFEKKSKDTDALLCQFSCFNSRCIAHPNIKSTNGDVLLIPNALSPRHNQISWNGPDLNTLAAENSAIAILQKGNGFANNEYKASTDNYIRMVEKTKGLKPNSISTLEEALKKSPRDNLHSILSINAKPGKDRQHPNYHPTKNNDDVMVSKQDCIRPFPDFSNIKNDEFSLETKGYSGRIQDLFINIEVIKNVVNEHEEASDILLNVMKQVSTAGGGFWDFAVIGGDQNTASTTTLDLIDRNFSGTENVDEQKPKAWLFNQHRSDSIITGCDFSAATKSEISSQVLFGAGGVTGPAAFYGRPKTITDLIANPNNFSKQTNDAIAKSSGTGSSEEEMADEQKYIIARKIVGATANDISKFLTYPEMSDGETDYAISYEDEDGTTRILEAKNEEEQQKNIQKVRNEGKENSIKTKNKVTNAKKYGDSAGRAKAKMYQRATWVYVTDEFIKRANNETVDGEGDKIKEEDSAIKVYQKLKGKIIKLSIGSDTWSGDEWKAANGDEKDDMLEDIEEDEFAVEEIQKLENVNDEWKYKIKLREQKSREVDNATLAAYLKARSEEKENIEDMPQSVKDAVSGLGEDGLDEIERQAYIAYPKHKGGWFTDDKNPFGMGSEGGYEEDVEMVDIDIERVRRECRLDDSPHNNINFNQPLPAGPELSLKFDGIEGLRLLDVFNCTGVPIRFYNKGIWAITAVKHSISDGNWETTIDALFYPGSTSLETD